MDHRSHQAALYGVPLNRVTGLQRPHRATKLEMHGALSQCQVLLSALGVCASQQQTGTSQLSEVSEYAGSSEVALCRYGHCVLSKETSAILRC
jgi:hypothetical protein